jgi:stage V sporulation protein R
MIDKDIDQLEQNIARAWDLAIEMGLDPYPVNFEIVPSSIMYEFGSYGLPGRFSHWTRGKAYYRMKTSYDFGLSKIYELVINTNPSYAFLLENNSVLENSFVAAHVFGHTDFFKHNAYFAHTARNMIDRVSVSAERIRQYEFEHGQLEVERFLDAVLAIEEHIDYNLRIKDKPEHNESATPVTTPYDDIWKLDKEYKKQQLAAQSKPKRRKFPLEPVKDIILFLADHAPDLEPWQRDILRIVHEEMLYFIPQMQTKIMNEGWACLRGDSLVLTEWGLMRYEALHDVLAAGEQIKAGSGSGGQDLITDRHITRNAATVRLKTRRGLVLEGAEHHKLSVGPDQWIDLKDVQVGQRIPLSVGDNIWPKEPVQIPTLLHAPIPTMDNVAVAAGVGYHTVRRYMDGRKTRSDVVIATAIAELGYEQLAKDRPLHSKRIQVVFPNLVTEELGAFLGYLIGDGNIETYNRTISFTSGDRESADHYSELVESLFVITPRIFWDDRTINGEGGRWRVKFYSQNVLDWLESIGIDLQAKARKKQIPDVILRSPKSVVSAFLRAYFDCDGCASMTNAVILSTFSDDIAQALQIILLNYGILSRRIGVNVHITGKSAALFEQEIGFGLKRKQDKLREFIAQRQWFKVEDPFDEVESIEHDTADVYDITVDSTHRYVANGMLHHNSIAHSRIMREMDLSNDDFVRFATLHTGVLAPSRTSLNPYHLGFTIWEDIERRWDNPTEEEVARGGRRVGQGKVKMAEVREMENDVSFIRNYLTEQLVKDLDLYMYRKEGDDWVIVEKDWEKVRDSIVANMTNFGYPYLVIEDADYRRNSELYIKHLFEGQEMDLNYAEKTLVYVYQIWGRPVHLETTFDEKRVLLSFDGERNTRQIIDDA